MPGSTAWNSATPTSRWAGPTTKNTIPAPGWAASNNGGGTYERELDENFYKGETLETFAEWFTRFRNDILRNEDLAYYFMTAQKRGHGC